MALAALLSLLGVQSEAEGIQLVTSFNTFVSDARAATGTASSAEALQAIQGNASLARQVEAITGKKGQEAANSLATLQAQATQSAVLAKQVSDLEANKATHERDAYIAELSTDQGPDKPAKLPPSLHAWAKTQTKAQLEAWAVGAPAFPSSATATNTHGGDAGVKPPTSGSSPSVLSAEELEVCRQLGVEPKAFLERKRFEEQNQNTPFATNSGGSVQ